MEMLTHIIMSAAVAVASLFGAAPADGLAANSAGAFETVEVGLAETSPLGDEGGYAVPASGSSVPTPTLTLTASPTTVSPGGSSTLTWTTSNATSCVASGAWSGSRSAGGGSQAQTGITTTRTFSMVCSGLGGTTPTQSVTVNVAAPTCNLNVSPASLPAGGGTVNLSWTTQNATGVTLWRSGAASPYGSTVPGHGAVLSLNGSYSASGITQASTFVLDIWNGNTTSSCSKSVTVAAAAPSIVLSASPATVPSGGSSTLYWHTANVTSCTASASPSLSTWTGSKGTGINRSQSLTNLTQTRTYTLTCTGPGGTVSDSTTITVTAAQTPTLTLSASQTSVPSGGSSTLTWTTSNVTSCTASASPTLSTWNGSKAAGGGNQNITNITQTRTYSMQCTGPGGTTPVRSVTISVAASGPTLTLSANPTSVSPGGSSTLTWTTSNTTSCTASASPAVGTWSGSKAAGGGSQVQSGITQTRVYSMQCTGPGGTTPIRSVVVNVANQPGVTLTANPTTVPSGGSSTLTWTTSNVTLCSGSGGWSGSKNANGGSQVINNITSNTTFNILCGNLGGNNVSASATVNVTSSTPTATLQVRNVSTNGPWSSSITIASGQTIALQWSSTNATSCTPSGTGGTPAAWRSGANSKGPSGTQTLTNVTTTGTYGITCSGPGGTSQPAYADVMVQASTPTLTLTANPTTVPSGGSSTLTWTTQNVTSCTASGGWTGSKAAGGGRQQVTDITETRTYTLTCTGPGGTISRNATVNVSAGTGGSIGPCDGITLVRRNVPICMEYDTGTSDPSQCVIRTGNQTILSSLSQNGEFDRSFANETTLTLYCDAGGHVRDVIMRVLPEFQET